MCSSFTAKRGNFAQFPIRASFEVDAAGESLSWFQCDVGELAPGTFPELPIGSVILFESHDGGGVVPHVVVGRRMRPVVWTPVIRLPEALQSNR